MNLKRLNLMFMILIGISSFGCSGNVQYVDRYNTVNVPIKCNPPQVDCNKYKHTLNSQQEELLACIDELTHALDVCK